MYKRNKRKFMVISRVRDCRGAKRPPQRSEEAGATVEPRKARPFACKRERQK